NSKSSRTTLRLEHMEEFAHEFVVPQSMLCLIEHRVASLCLWQCRLIRPGCHQSVVDVNNLEHARKDWDVMALESIRISGTVPILVVVADDRQHFAKRLQRLTDGLAVSRMPLHHIPLFRSELAAFLQDLIWNFNFAQIMQITTAL